MALLRIINIYLIFYISLLKKASLEILSTLIIEIKPLNSNTKYKVKKILYYKYINNKVKYLIK